MTKEIYSLIGADGYECVLPVNKADHETLTFDGSPRISSWRPVLMRRVNGNAGKKRPSKESDFPWQGTSHSLVLRNEALEAMRDILDKNCEVLPLETEDKVRLYITNTQVIPALDMEKSEVRRFPNSEKIMYIKQPYFKSDLLREVDIFRDAIIELRTFVSEKFVNRYHEKKLRGLVFHKIQVLE